MRCGAVSASHHIRINYFKSISMRLRRADAPVNWHILHGGGIFGVVGCFSSSSSSSAS